MVNCRDDKSGDEKSDDEEKDDDARPLTQEELRTKMKRKIAGSREFLTVCCYHLADFFVLTL